MAGIKSLKAQSKIFIDPVRSVKKLTDPEGRLKQFCDCSYRYVSVRDNSVGTCIGMCHFLIPGQSMRLKIYPRWRILA